MFNDTPIMFKRIEKLPPTMFNDSDYQTEGHKLFFSIGQFEEVNLWVTSVGQLQIELEKDEV